MRQEMFRPFVLPSPRLLLRKKSSKRKPQLKNWRSSSVTWRSDVIVS